MHRELFEGKNRRGGGESSALPPAGRDHPLPAPLLLLLRPPPLLSPQLPPLLPAQPLPTAAHPPLPLTPPPAPLLLLLSLDAPQQVAVAPLHLTEASSRLLSSSPDLVLLFGAPDPAFEGFPVVATPLVSFPPVLVPFVRSVVDDVRLVPRLLCSVAHAVALVFVHRADQIGVEMFVGAVW